MLLSPTVAVTVTLESPVSTGVTVSVDPDTSASTEFPRTVAV